MDEQESISSIEDDYQEMYGIMKISLFINIHLPFEPFDLEGA